MVFRAVYNSLILDFFYSSKTCPFNRGVFTIYIFLFDCSLGSTGHYRLLCRRLQPLPEFSPRFLQCTYCWKARIPASDLNLNVLNPDPADPQCRHEYTDMTDATLDSQYTPDQRHTILQLLNTGSESELASVKMLRGRKSANIIQYRIRNGPFKNLETVVNVPLLKHKSAIVAFNSILHPSEKKEKRKGKIHLAKFIRPEVDKALLEVTEKPEYSGCYSKILIIQFNKWKFSYVIFNIFIVEVSK